MATIKSFWNYYQKADTIYSIHSPFLFQLLQETIENQKKFYAFSAIEQLRFRLLKNKTKLQITDLGAGSRVDKSPQREIASIAKNAVSPKWQCQFLFKLIDWLQPKNRLEIGTSLGINTLYQYLPLQHSTFYTLEGCPNIAKAAQRNFDLFQAKNIKLIVGDFAQTLAPTLAKIKRLDYVFIDGNHQKKPTISYFDQCLAYSHKDTIFVIDDIHWSDEMQAAWKQIQQHPKVSLSLDFFYFGLIFLRAEPLEKQHFNLIPIRYKPWKVALL